MQINIFPHVPTTPDGVGTLIDNFLSHAGISTFFASCDIVAECPPSGGVNVKDSDEDGVLICIEPSPGVGRQCYLTFRERLDASQQNSVITTLKNAAHSFKGPAAFAGDARAAKGSAASEQARSGERKPKGRRRTQEEMYSLRTEVKRAIRNGEVTPTHLAVMKKFKVHTASLRMVFTELIKEGVLFKAGRRFELASGLPAGVADVPVTKDARHKEISTAELVAVVDSFLEYLPLIRERLIKTDEIRELLTKLREVRVI